MAFGLALCPSGVGVAADAGAAGEAVAESPKEGSRSQRAPLPIVVLPRQYRDPGESKSTYGHGLKRAQDGSNDLIAETPSFTARVSPDGRVRFEDHPGKLTLRPGWLPAPVRPGTQSLEGLLRERLKVLPKARWEANEPDYKEPEAVIPLTSPYRPDVRGQCEHPRPCHLALKPHALNLMGRFDLTDELVRLGGQDPNRYEKARFLAETRELRLQLAIQAYAENLRTQLGKLPDTLRAIACDERRTVAERAAILGALQAEMDTTLPEGRFAVAQIRGFLRRWQKSPDGAAVCPEHTQR